MTTTLRRYPRIYFDALIARWRARSIVARQVRCTKRRAARQAQRLVKQIQLQELTK